VIEFSILKQRLTDFARFSRYCARRFLRDGGPRTAAALSYSSLLAMVPLLALFAALLSAFGDFDEIGRQLQDEVFDALLPEAARAVSDQLSGFIDNARRMTGIGLLGLAVTAVLLLNTINGSFNDIWRAREPRPLVTRVLVYWAILSLGPLLVGASVSLSTYAFAAVEWAGIESYAKSRSGIARLLPFALAALGFTMLFTIVPNRVVRLRHAVTGAVFAAVLFELLKVGFGAYLRHFPSYQAIYGVLAAVPIFLVWMYLSWAVMLIGAEIAASLPEWRAAEARRRSAHRPGARLALALALLGPTLEELGQVLSQLRRHGYAVRSGAHRWVLGRDLSAVTLEDLVRVLQLSLDPGEGWPDHVTRSVETLARAASEPAHRSLAEILDEAPEESSSLRLV
jgi:membrane protein